MDFIKLLILSVLVLYGILQVYSILDPFTLAATSGFIAGIAYVMYDPETRKTSFKYARKAFEKPCQIIGYCEGCEDYWIHSNLQGLEYDLKSEVFGQTLAIEMVLGALKSHLNNTKRKRSLVLSFQGSPGTGKNFVSQHILKNIFKKGDGSKYVKFFRGSIDFTFKSQVDRYKEDLIQTIKEMVYDCQRSVFIFDEVEKMPDGILDVISSFVRAEKEGEYDFRNVTFILLSNVGSGALNYEALKAWRNGIHRNEMNSKELTQLLAKEAYNSAGGFSKTTLVKNHDVTYFVPFLPLERQHIIQCLEREVANRNQIMSPELTELVLEELTFFPEPESIFATHGCKQVGEKVDMLIERVTRKRRKSGRTRYSSNALV